MNSFVALVIERVCILGKPKPNQSRLIAYELVSQVNRQGAYANLRLPELLSNSKMEQSDRAFTTELAYGTLRMQGKHDYIASKYLDRSIDEVDPKIVDLIRIGIHQITQMRVPNHAAVSETVEVAKFVAGESKASYVNAILRKVTSEEASIVKREWWQEWESDDPPSCDFVLQVWDTAFEKTSRADYSACTTWGVFYHPDDNGETQANIILLNAFRDRMEFPELKERAQEEYKYWNPDSLIVEAKAAGSPLIFELRAMGIPVQEFTPSKGNDKIARLNAVADIFASGRVWVPNTHWAEELVEEVASFPSGEHDDLVDSMTQALLRYRQGGFLRLASDEPEPERFFKRRREGYY